MNDSLKPVISLKRFINSVLNNVYNNHSETYYLNLLPLTGKVIIIIIKNTSHRIIHNGNNINIQ